MSEPLHWLPAWRLAELVSRGDVSATELCAAFLERVEGHDHTVHAFVTIAAERAVAAAARLDRIPLSERTHSLFGVPYAVKDNLFTSGIRTTCGSRLLVDFVPDIDAAAVRRLGQAVLIGKTNLPEFSGWARSRNLVAEETLNPWNTARSAGASSGGSAAAVAAGLIPFSLATDDGGSVRIPAALTGVFGFAPTPGTLPMEGTVTFGSASVIGPICRHVRDAAEVLDTGGEGLVAGLDTGVAGVRAAWLPDHEGIDVVDRRVVDVARSAAHALVEVGASIEEPAHALLDASAAMAPVMKGNSHQFPGLRPFDVPEFQRAAARPDWRELLAPYSDPDILSGARRPTQEQVDLHTVRQRAVRDQMDGLFSTYDLLLTPVLDEIACAADDTWEPTYGGPERPGFLSLLSYVKYTARVNAAGCPAASVPSGFVDGLPVGLQVIGRPGEDALVLRACRALEQIRPWAQNRPPAFA